MVRPRNPNLRRPGWQEEWAPEDGDETCGVSRGPRGETFCEMPPDHKISHEGVPYHEASHMGRSPSGRWYTWPSEEK